VKQPFAKWHELEATYHYVTTYAPELLSASYTEAKGARVQAHTRQASLDPKTGDVLLENGHIAERDKEGAQIAHPKSQSKRAKKSGISRRTQQHLDWLARNAKEQFERVRNGELSVHRACIQAGHIKEMSPLNVLIEPWLGKYEDLKETYARYERGDITREQGVRELEQKKAQELARDPAVKRLATESEANELRAIGGKRGGRGNKNLHDKIREVYGTSQEYLVRRLKRDAPDIAEALGRGEYPSARAAAKAAGIIKELTPLDLSLVPSSNPQTTGTSTRLSMGASMGRAGTGISPDRSVPQGRGEEIHPASD
jgi:hypothetical protein